MARAAGLPGIVALRTLQPSGAAVASHWCRNSGRTMPATDRLPILIGFGRVSIGISMIIFLYGIGESIKLSRDNRECAGTANHVLL
jgi:hypothetical protein